LQAAKEIWFIAFRKSNVMTSMPQKVDFSRPKRRRLDYITFAKRNSGAGPGGREGVGGYLVHSSAIPRKARERKYEIELIFAVVAANVAEW
jgi:hypothetical protein